MTEQKYRARLSLGYYDSPDDAKRARFEAESILAATTAQEARSATEAPSRVDIPANVNLVPVKPLTLDLDRWLYASDFHAPVHSRLWARRLIAVAERENIHDFVIGGDLLDLDSTSRHPKTLLQAGINRTLESAGDLLVALASTFDKIYILPGNHCRRVANKLDEPLDFGSLIHAAVKGRVASSKLVTTNYSYIFVGTEDTGWSVGHPAFFEGSGVPGLSRAAIRNRRNVIGSHTHAMSFSWTFDGRHKVIYPGHMSDESITPYVQETKGLSKFAEWKNGFVLIDNNIPTLFADGLVDWSRYER